MRWRRVFLGVLSVGYSKIVVAFMQLAMVPVLATTWGLDTYGQWLMLTTVPIFLGASDFGFGTAAGNRLTAEVAKGQFDEALRTFQSALAVMLLCTFSIFAICLTATLLLPDSLLAAADGLDGDSARQVLAIMCLFGLVALQSSLFMSVMRAEGLFAQTTSLYATMQLGEGIAVMAVALAGGGPVIAAIAYCSIRTIGVSAQAVLALSRAKWLKLGLRQGTKARVRELLRPALAAMMLPLSQALHLQGTALAVGAAAGAAAVPIYTSLRTLSRTGLQLLMTLTLPILPEFTAEHARENSEWVKRITGGIATFNSLAGIVAAIGMLLLGEWFLDLWTKGAIQPPYEMLALTAIAMAASMVWNPLSNLLVAVNRHETFTYSFLIIAALATALTYAFVVQWGIVGSAAASLLLDFVMLAITWLLVRRMTGPFPMGRDAVRILLPSRFRRR